MEDEYLKCYYDKWGIKRWKCKKCGDEGLVDSVHVMQWNEKNNIIATPAGMNELREWLNTGKEFSFR